MTEPTPHPSDLPRQADPEIRIEAAQATPAIDPLPSNKVPRLTAAMQRLQESAIEDD